MNGCLKKLPAVKKLVVDSITFLGNFQPPISPRPMPLGTRRASKSFAIAPRGLRGLGGGHDSRENCLSVQSRVLLYLSLHRSLPNDAGVCISSASMPLRFPVIS